MKFRIEVWTEHTSSVEVERFLQRPAFDDEAEKVSAKVLAEIREKGDSAVLAATEQFTGAKLNFSEMQVSDAEVAAAARAVPAKVKANIRAARQRVARFAKAGLRKDWKIATGNGGSLGERFLPLDRVGVYIPGGTAPLASTAIMTIPIAKAAGVSEIVACTPCAPDGSVNPTLLFALREAGATEIWRIGGIQAVGMMAYGTQSMRPVQKIVGPGGAFVTAAKRQVYGAVALDLVAGPSEIAIVADKNARPDWIAADLLSQIEHGTGNEKALLATDSAELAQAVCEEVNAQLPLLSRAKRMEKGVENGMMFVVTSTVEEAATLVNRFAPEHLELLVERPKRLLPKLSAAGAIFIGSWSPEPVGDFAAGPSHVLPTGGAATRFSGLTVEDFRRRTSIIDYTKKDLLDAMPIIETFGAIEGLDAHTKSATIRFDKPRNLSSTF